jgi:hypothetical protein
VHDLLAKPSMDNLDLFLPAPGSRVVNCRNDNQAETTLL